MIHHFAFIAAGLLMRSHCMLPFNAAVLLSMEVSTIPLSYFLLYRHRGDAFKFRSLVSGVAFAISFLLMRIVMNTYGTYLLWKNWSDGSVLSVDVLPQWQSQLLLAAVTVGAVMQ